jgi:tRNA threonylcarbamoyladenosine biosynthesis protein TsaE
MLQAEFLLENLDETNALGQKLGALLFPGAVVALEGMLGAGKTHLTRAIAVGLGVKNPMVVTSPTFVLMQQYRGHCMIHHFDVYRLKNVDEFLDLGVEDLFPIDGVSIIEWADKVRTALPEEMLWIRLEAISENQRKLKMQATGEAYESIIQSLSSSPES